MPQDISIEKLEEASRRFDQRFRTKKLVNLCISILIVALGVVPMYLVFAVKEGIYAFRFLTVNGTLFTMAGSLIFIAVNLYELTTGREMTLIPVYYVRLSCAVTESIIMIVVLIGLVLGDPSGLDEWDEIMTHAVMPVLTVASFLTNDSPVGKVRPLYRFCCTSFITVYGLIIITLFATKTLPMDMIPYPFLDTRVMPFLEIAGVVILIYLIAFGISTLLYLLNRKLSWLWFRNIAKFLSPSP